MTKLPKEPPIWIGNGDSCYAEEAIEIITDEYIDSGQYCDQTVLDMRDWIAWALTVFDLLHKKAISNDHPPPN